MEEIKKIHFVGVGGVGMGTMAVALANAGCRVSGSDGALYEPMKSVLRSADVTLFEGFLPATAEMVETDLVIIGNVVRKDNPEAMAWLRRGTRFMSFPEAVRTFLIQDKRSMVCAGTHGKTTTTTWLAYLFVELGLNPSYLIGGVPRDLSQGCVLGTGDIFIGEGDEYDSSFFDKGPKFLHYNPHFLVISNIEFDHADIYRDLEHVKASFEKLVALLPGDGLCIARFEDPVVMSVVSGALCPVQTFGRSPGAMWRLGSVEEDEKGVVFEVIYKNRSVGTFRTALFGEHNLLNLMSGIVVAVNSGVPMERVRPIVESFRGVKRRQEILMEKPIVLVDDFAHHPTEVAATLKAVRKRFPDGTLWALFEPRSATARRNIHQEEYAKAFDAADQILVAAPYKGADLNESERFSTDSLVSSLKTAGKSAASFKAVDEIVAYFLSTRKANDIVVVMSNGEFDKIQEKLKRAVSQG